jgi:hypothetical protein
VRQRRAGAADAGRVVAVLTVAGFDMAAIPDVKWEISPVS